MTIPYTGQMTGFTKLFSTIVHSTIWREDKHVKVLWVTMLAMADRKGRVFASVPGLADAARITLDECVDALTRLSSPDEWSRTQVEEGRRIATIDGGWVLLNYLKYREMRDADERRIQTREHVRAHRERRKAESITVSNVSHGKPKQKQKQKQKKKEKTDSASDEAERVCFEETWTAYPKRPNNSKSDALKQWSARRKEGVPVVDMLEGTKRYAAFCLAEKIEGKYIKQAATFYGKGRHWESDYTVSKSPERQNQAGPAYPKYKPPVVDRTVGMGTMADEMEKLKAKLGIGGAA